MAMHFLRGRAFDKAANVNDQNDPTPAALTQLKLLSHSFKSLEQHSAKAFGMELGVPAQH